MLRVDIEEIDVDFFAFIARRNRDGKPAYVKDTPRFLGYARTVAERYASLSPLLHLLDQLADRKPAVGYTF